ncbi:transcriptional regulator containing PAS, AAA-type ATPase, and DNA-binding domains [Desulfosporosinus orientis DSM 765]|uniref:Transcriptional regulator containing PAS, AAA-type ATPase, and DNA-binding domains n=1 Tax=Desulfosporosinus orientis (strain ATCC 19365 / DSM 765 / NCIMB 8382 / VKM B-1628 / Singapore I) TaxID=768706 RepID=G7WFH7_DESOD|nr:sigma 54-interacting transcriptional regulator [Desulfosporosinus orientis]AET68420.1 transcriptional regulator containing PAS, AAA-type ATPase, and DNA-binding domains [Desulfosporosinus orientis DSM 765]
MGRTKNYPNILVKPQTENKLSIESLQQIMNCSHDPIFVTDKYGNCIVSTDSFSMAYRTLGLKPQELVGKNVRDFIKAGIYNWSPTLKALETGSTVTGLIKTINGSEIMVTSTPVKDDNCQIIMIVTNIRDKDIVEKYSEELKREKNETERYKMAVEYLGKVANSDNAVISESPQMKKILETADIVAKTESTVSLYGETGTGKEVLARYIHHNSRRVQRPFIPVNCAAIPQKLFESEFFGYVKGAFTGANPQGKMGLFEIANHGTLFLDEIGELPLEMQSKLLRVLETGEIQRIGSIKTERIDVRLIVATNKDLRHKVDQEQFRSDLFYRLNVIPFTLPPLRERKEDIGALAQKFLGELNAKYGLHKVIPPHTLRVLLNYNWPGNIRELRNVIEREYITSTQDGIKVKFEAADSSAAGLASPSREDKAGGAYKGTLKSVLKKVEAEYINEVLNECNGKVGEASRLLGIHRTVLYRKTKLSI